MESPETPSNGTTTRGGGTTTSRVDELMPHLLDALLSPSPALQTLLANLDPTRPRPDLSRPSRRPRRRHP